MTALVFVERPFVGRLRRAPEPFLSQPAPRLPRHDRLTTQGAFGSASLLFHAVALAALVVLASTAKPPDLSPLLKQKVDTTPLRFVFLPKSDPGGGGGGGGNRQRAPIPRAQAKGRDVLTLPVARPIVPAARPADASPPIQSVALDARPLLSGSTLQAGLPQGVATVGISQGPGSGGGAGDGVGTGIGSGRGPGLGPGSGGGTGGGLYRPGAGVTAPTLLREVRPTYTPDALRAKIQGSVFLDVIVQRDGTPGDIRIVRSLDPAGLDRQAVLAVQEWRFKPGRLSGVPVDVLVTIVLEFRIH